MIIDHIQNFARYISLHRNLEKVEELLKIVEQQGFPEGIFSFDDYTLTCESSTQELSPKTQKEIIVYYTLEGTDCIGTTEKEIKLPTDYIAIFLPHEAHAPIKTQVEPYSSLEDERGKQDTSVATKGRLLNLAEEQHEGDYFPQSASRENKTQLGFKSNGNIKRVIISIPL